MTVILIEIAIGVALTLAAAILIYVTRTTKEENEILEKHKEKLIGQIAVLKHKQGLGK